MWYKIKTYLGDGIAVEAVSKDVARRKFLDMVITGELTEDDFTAEESLDDEVAA